MPTRVTDVVQEVERERHRALLYSYARQQLARRFLNPTREEDAVDFDVLAEVLEHLLIEANAATQRTQRLLRQRVAT